MAKTPRNLSKPGANTCDECDKKHQVLWKARFGLWLCPLCWEKMEWVSDTRRKLIDDYKWKTKIKVGSRFRDNSGCLLEVTGPETETDIWCKGIPDVIGVFLYSKSTVLKGLVED